MSRRGPLALAALAAFAGCAGQVTVPSPPSPARAEPPAGQALRPDVPTRWLQGGAATLIGPGLPGGTLVLLGGRRALLAPGGSLRTETSPAPEPLLEVALVPTAAGNRLVGRGNHGVYRFDDPLGAAVPLGWAPAGLERLGTAPGLVAVWTGGAQRPRFLDVETGAAASLPGLPALPLRAVAFRDTRRGAAIFAAAGLAVSSDGGATFRQVGEGLPVASPAVSRLEVVDGGIRASTGEGTPSGRIDEARGELEALTPASPRAGQPPLLQWIRATHRDPLEAATTGVASPGGGALVASHGLMARVDPATGAIEELVELAAGDRPTECSIAHAAATAWVACALPAELGGPALFDPFGVIEVPWSAGPLVAGRTLFVRNGAGVLLASPSGAVMLTGPCRGPQESEGQACVRQPSGKWETVTAPTGALGLGERGVGPLADGRIAMLRALAPEVDPPYPGGEAAGSVSGLPYVVLVDAAGKETAFAPPFWSASLPEGPLHVESPIEQDESGALRFVVGDGSASYAVAQSPGREASAAVIPGATSARVHGRHGLAVGPGHVLTSLDAGATWAEVQAPARARDAARRGEALEVGELGAQVGADLRLGWDPSAALPVEPAAAIARHGGALERKEVEADEPSSGRPPMALHCRFTGRARPPTLWIGSVSSGATSPAPPDGSQAPRPGQRTERSSLVQGQLDTRARLEVKGYAGRAPETWYLQWFDPGELGGSWRHWRGAAPPGTPWETSLHAAAASEGNALFLLHAGSRPFLVRVGPDGQGEIAEAGKPGSGTLVAASVVFGRGKGAPVAFSESDGSIVVWRPDEPEVRLLARATSAVLLGRPAGGKLPVFLDASWRQNDEGAFSFLSLPGPSSSPSPPAAAVPLHGWTKLQLPRRGLASLPACGPRARGAELRLGDLGELPAFVDGARFEPRTSVYDLRIDGTEACLAGLVSAGKLTAASGSAGDHRDPDAELLRVDLAGKRGELGSRALACTLEANR